MSWCNFVSVHPPKLNNYMVRLDLHLVWARVVQPQDLQSAVHWIVLRFCWTDLLSCFALPEVGAWIACDIVPAFTSTNLSPPVAS